MLSLILFNIVSNNANFLYPNDSCNYLDEYKCINSYGCGWCNNTFTELNITGCKYIGFCGINEVYGTSCNYMNTNYLCGALRWIFAFVIFIIFVTISYTLLLGMSRCLLRYDYSPVCKILIQIICISLVILPLLVSYYYNYISLAIFLGAESIFAIGFWICNGGRIMRTYNNPNYEINNLGYSSI